MQTKQQKTYDLTDVDFCVFTGGSEREAMEALLGSIVATYPSAVITIADNNHELDRPYYKQLQRDLAEAGLLNRIHTHRVPYGCDWTVARNFLATNTPSKYKLFLDENQTFNEDTNVLAMVAVLEQHPSVGLVVGAIDDADGLVGKKDVELSDGVPEVYRSTTVGSRFMLVRKDVMRYIRFESGDENLSRFSALLPKQVPFSLVVMPKVIIHTQSSEDAKTETNQSTQGSTPSQTSSGDGDGATTQPTVPSTDAGKPEGSDSVPGGKNETAPGKTTGGGQGGSDTRRVRGNSH